MDYRNDFEGNPYQTGNFIERRQACTLGPKATWLNGLEGELHVPDFYGVGQDNAGRNRDNVGASIKCSF